MKFLSFWLVAASLLSRAAWSAPPSGLHEFEVPVADQSETNRPTAIAEAQFSYRAKDASVFTSADSTGLVQPGDRVYRLAP